MTKSDLVAAIAKRTGLSRKTVEQAVNGVFESMSEALSRHERIEVRGFGNFHVRHYDGYTGRNPRTLEEVVVPPKVLPHFRVGKGLKDRLSDE